MRLDHETNVEPAPELKAIATAAAERLRAHADAEEPREAQLQRGVGEAASRAITARASLSAIADAERAGEARAREELGRDVLRAVEHAARRKREAEQAYEHAVFRAARLGLAHRKVAAAAQVAHGTIRAILARSQTASRNRTPRATAGRSTEADAEQQSADAL